MGPGDVLEEVQELGLTVDSGLTVIIVVSPAPRADYPVAH
jgi:hypothetical protein